MVTSFKYLEVTIDGELKWSEHILNIKIKIKISTVLFYKICYFDTLIICHVYVALCNLIIVYSIRCWGGTNRTNIKTLHTAQKNSNKRSSLFH